MSCLIRLSLVVEGERVGLDTVIRKNTLIRHRIHRHEPPVLHCPLKIIHQDKEMLVIDKPPSIPVSLPASVTTN